MSQTQESTTQSVIEALQTHGDARDSVQWDEGNPDYIALYSLTAEHIPALIALATRWVDDSSPVDEAVYGPVHAWRALGQLRAIEAVEPLLNLQDQLDARHDDWYLEEFHCVFGLIGSPAIPLLSAYLADASHGEYPRSKAAGGLAQIVKRFPETRDRILALLNEELARHRANAEELNGFILSELLDLEAVESAETIERAFAANVIDPTIAGDWEVVRAELGVPGLGIAPDHSPGWPAIREQMGLPHYSFPKWDPFADPPKDAAERKKEQIAQRKAKAKRKKQEKDRKRNRK